MPLAEYGPPQSATTFSSLRLRERTEENCQVSVVAHQSKSAQRAEPRLFCTRWVGFRSVPKDSRGLGSLSKIYFDMLLLHWLRHRQGRERFAVPLALKEPVPLLQG
jgi:hypothetical protein